MPDSNLHQLSALGQSVWIDYLSRQMLQSGKLARMMAEDAVVGVTSNPTIFQKAISRGRLPTTTSCRRCSSRAKPTRRRSSSSSPSNDISRACDLLRKVWDEGQGLDGYVSMEVDPTLAYDRDGTIAEASRLHEWIDRPNLLREDPGDGARARRDRGDDRGGQQHQRHADLLARAP